MVFEITHFVVLLFLFATVFLSYAYKNVWLGIVSGILSFFVGIYFNNEWNVAGLQFLFYIFAIVMIGFSIMEYQ